MKKRLLIGGMLVLAALFVVGAVWMWNSYLRPAKNILVTALDRHDPALIGSAEADTAAPYILVQGTACSIAQDVSGDVIEPVMCCPQEDPAITAEPGDAAVVIDGMNVHVTYADGAVRTFTVQMVPAALEGISVEGTLTDDAFLTVCGEDGAYYAVQLDTSGDLRYYRRLNEQGSHFRRQYNAAGQTRYTYLERTGSSFVTDAEADINCAVLVVLDEAYREIDRVVYQNGDGTWQNADANDYIYIDDGHYILASYRPQIVRNITGGPFVVMRGAAAVCVVEEVQNDEILWEFRSDAYDRLYAESNRDGLNFQLPEYQDYMHINALALTDDNAVICSFMHLDAVIKIDREDGTVLWQLGGTHSDFTLPEGVSFAQPLGVKALADGRIAVADDAGMLLFALDEARRKASAERIPDVEEGGVLSAAQQEVWLACSTNTASGYDCSTGESAAVISFREGTAVLSAGVYQ